MAGTPKDTHYANLRRAHRERTRGPAEPEPHRLYGLHAVEAALANPKRRIARVLATRNAAARLPGGALDGRNVETVEPRALDALLGPDAVHQGIAIECDPLPDLGLDALPDTDLVLALDQVTDPHNVGAILRSAVAMGAGAVVTTTRNAPPETATLAKAASGALEHVALLRVRNLSAALADLSARGYRTVGLDSDGPSDLEGALGTGPLCLVMGAEGRGLREKTRASVDALARLDMPGAIRSLNVSNAAAVALYVARRHLGTSRVDPSQLDPSQVDAP